MNIIKNVIIFAVGSAIGGVVGYYFGKKKGLSEIDDQLEDFDDYHKISENYTRRPKTEETNRPENENNEKVVDYSEYYDHYQDDPEDDTPATKAIRFHEENRNRPPEFVPESSLGDVPGFYDRQTLFYYAYDETVTDEDECVIDEPGLLLGTLLEDTGFIEDNNDVLYVINFQTDCLYEVDKVYSSYTETHEYILANQEEGGEK